jgi:DNA mismatch endonuclease, patch repair protein
MRTTKRRDTRPELAFRSALHAMGLRFQVDKKIDANRGKTDVAFPTERVAVYVDGCFWHACPDHGTIPKQNRDWWVAKLEANKARDLATTRALTAAGWRVIRFWEHDDPVDAAQGVYDHVLAIRANNNRNGRATPLIGRTVTERHHGSVAADLRPPADSTRVQ